MKDLAEARRLPIAGARNLRDLGGYATIDGRRVRRGLVYRCGHPGGLTEDGRTALAALGLRAIVDLRGNSERAHTPFPAEVTAAARCWSRDHEGNMADFLTLLRNPVGSAAEMHAFMLATYRALPFDQSASIAAMLRLLAAGEVPLLVNCTAGKDRTGIASAILLLALGVPLDQVVEDYSLTEWLEDPAAQMFKGAREGPFAATHEVNPEVWQTMNRSDPDYLHAALAALDQRHGSVAGFLTDGLSLTPAELAQLQNVLLEG